MTSTRAPLTDSAYNFTKKLTTVYLPGAATLYFTVAMIWGLPHPEQVVGTIAAINVFLGLVLNASSKIYNDSDNQLGKYAGDLMMTNQPGTAPSLLLELNQDPSNLKDKGEVFLKVKRLRVKPRPLPFQEPDDDHVVPNEFR